jgi:hypothetical protein
MEGLLGDVNKSIAYLQQLTPLLPADQVRMFVDKMCTETDLCPIAQEPELVGYLNRLGCNSTPRSCPAPPITVK